MIKVDENRIGTIDGLPWQLSHLPDRRPAPRLYLNIAHYRDVGRSKSPIRRWRS